MLLAKDSINITVYPQENSLLLTFSKAVKIISEVVVLSSHALKQLGIRILVWKSILFN